MGRVLLPSLPGSPLSAGAARAAVSRAGTAERTSPEQVPWWGAVCSAAAPVLLAAGSTIGGHLQPRPYNAMTGAVSALAALGVADRWVITLAFAAAGACEIATGLALRPAAVAGRLILVTGGAAGLLVAASPEPAGGGGSPRHALTAAVGLAAMAAWSAAARRRGPSEPWGLQPRVSAARLIAKTEAGRSWRVTRSRGHGRWPWVTALPPAGTRRRDYRRSGRDNPPPRASKGSRNGR
jgi:Protein of unknown function (DUF998)